MRNIRVGDRVQVEGIVVDRWHCGRTSARPGDYQVVRLSGGNGYVLVRSPMFLGFPEGSRVDVNGIALLTYSLTFQEDGREKTGDVLLLNSRSSVITKK